jgi:hypothetical protein
MATCLTQRDVRRISRLLSLYPEDAPFKRFITRDKAVQIAECGLVERESTVLHNREQVLRTLREVQDLLLIGYLPTTHGDTVEQRLHLGKRKGISFEHARIPHEFRQHAMKAEAHPFDRVNRDVLRNRGAVPLKAEVGEKRHCRWWESGSGHRTAVA